MEWITVSLGQRRLESTHVYSFRLHSASLGACLPSSQQLRCAVYEALQALSGGMEPPGLRLAAYLVRTAHLPPGKDSLKTSMEGVLTLYDIKTLYLKVILENHCALYSLFIEELQRFSSTSQGLSFTICGTLANLPDPGTEGRTEGRSAVRGLATVMSDRAASH